MRHTLLIIILLLGYTNATAATELNDALRRVDRQIEMRSTHLDRRQHDIDSLVRQLKRNRLNSALIDSIADAYTGFDNDSAIAYLTRGIESAGDDDTRRFFTWKRASLYPLTGLMQSALSDFASLPPDSVPVHLRASYYDSGRQLYSYLSTYYSSFPELSRRFADMALRMQEKLLDELPPQSPAHGFNLGEYYFLTGSPVKARVLLQEIIDNAPEDSRYTARAAHHLARIAHDDGNNDEYLRYLALSALADLQTATREVASLQELGVALQNSGQTDRAYRYLTTAVENAVECGAPLRMIESAKALPIIEKAHSRNIENWRRNMYRIVVLLVFILLVLGITLFALRREMRKMKALEHKLRSANSAKEVYIGQFLKLCSIYMDKLNQFCKISTRKIASGQTDELYRMVKSGKFIEEQSNEFYNVFDSAFLHLFPDFVNRVNELLLPDAQIQLREGEKLNTDLRILAFVRLGIEESARIAQVLNYSLNTIYAYRNRLKARAINRDTFELDVMAIEGDA